MNMIPHPAVLHHHQQQQYLQQLQQQQQQQPSWMPVMGHPSASNNAVAGNPMMMPGFNMPYPSYLAYSNNPNILNQQQAQQLAQQQAQQRMGASGMNTGQSSSMMVNPSGNNIIPPSNPYSSLPGYPTSTATANPTQQNRMSIPPNPTNPGVSVINNNPKAIPSNQANIAAGNTQQLRPNLPSNYYTIPKERERKPIEIIDPDTGEEVTTDSKLPSHNLNINTNTITTPAIPAASRNPITLGDFITSMANKGGNANNIGNVKRPNAGEHLLHPTHDQDSMGDELAMNHSLGEYSEDDTDILLPPTTSTNSNNPSSHEVIAIDCSISSSSTVDDHSFIH